MMLRRRPREWMVGKTIAKVEIDDEYTDDDTVMMLWLVLHFTDGTSSSFGLDWRGRDCYISEYAHDPARV